MMLDDSDVDLVAVAGLSTDGGIFGCLFVLLVLAVMTYFVAQNKEECSEMKCPHGGTPTLQNHECQCVEKAVKP